MNSSTPLTVQGMLISDKEFRSYSTDYGELINGISLNVSIKKSILELFHL